MDPKEIISWLMLTWKRHLHTLTLNKKLNCTKGPLILQKRYRIEIRMKGIMILFSILIQGVKRGKMRERRRRRVRGLGFRFRRVFIVGNRST